MTIHEEVYVMTNYNHNSLEALINAAQEREDAKKARRDEHSQKVLAAIRKNIIAKSAEPNSEDIAEGVIQFLTGRDDILEAGCSVFFGMPDEPIETQVFGNYTVALAKNTNPTGRPFVVGIVKRQTNALDGILKVITEKAKTDSVEISEAVIQFLTGRDDILEAGCSVFFGMPDEPIETQVFGNYTVALAKNTNPTGRPFVVGIVDNRVAVAKHLGKFLRRRLGIPANVSLMHETLKQIVDSVTNGHIKVCFVRPLEARNAKGNSLDLVEGCKNYSVIPYTNKNGESYLTVTSIDWWTGLKGEAEEAPEVDFKFD